MIKLENVCKNFSFSGQKVAALRGVSLEIASGDRVAILGKSGAGKSTLLHIIGTLDQASSGKIYIDGQDVTLLDDRRLSSFRNQKIGFVFQMNNLLSEFSALENVMMPGLIAGKDQKSLQEKAHELLSAVGLAKRASHRPGELSGGEQQRVAVARALIMSPTLLLADEPTGNLDVKTGELIQDLLFKLCEDYKITMLMVTHDERLAAKMPRRIIMEDGLVIDEGLSKP